MLQGNWCARPRRAFWLRAQTPRGRFRPLIISSEQRPVRYDTTAQLVCCLAHCCLACICHASQSCTSRHVAWAACSLYMQYAAGCADSIVLCLQAVRTAEAVAAACTQQERSSFRSLEFSQRGGMLALLPDALVLMPRPGAEAVTVPVALAYAEWSPTCNHIIAVRPSLAICASCAHAGCQAFVPQAARPCAQMEP